MLNFFFLLAKSHDNHRRHFLQINVIVRSLRTDKCGKQRATFVEGFFFTSSITNFCRVPCRLLTPNHSSRQNFHSQNKLLRLNVINSEATARRMRKRIRRRNEGKKAHKISRFIITRFYFRIFLKEKDAPYVACWTRLDSRFIFTLSCSHRKSLWCSLAYAVLWSLDASIKNYSCSCGEAGNQPALPHSHTSDEKRKVETRLDSFSFSLAKPFLSCLSSFNWTRKRRRKKTKKSQISKRFLWAEFFYCIMLALLLCSSEISSSPLVQMIWFESYEFRVHWD